MDEDTWEYGSLWRNVDKKCYFSGTGTWWDTLVHFSVFCFVLRSLNHPYLLVLSRSYHCHLPINMGTEQKFLPLCSVENGLVIVHCIGCMVFLIFKVPSFTAIRGCIIKPSPSNLHHPRCFAGSRARFSRAWLGIFPATNFCFHFIAHRYGMNSLTFLLYSVSHPVAFLVVSLGHGVFQLSPPTAQNRRFG